VGKDYVGKKLMKLFLPKLIRIKKDYGPESVIFCTGTGKRYLVYLRRLGRSYGSANDYICFGPLDGRACAAPKRAVLAAVLGNAVSPDFAQNYADKYENQIGKSPNV